MFLDCGSKPEHPQKTHADKGRTPHRDHLRLQRIRILKKLVIRKIKVVKDNVLNHYQQVKMVICLMNLLCDLNKNDA